MSSRGSVTFHHWRVMAMTHTRGRNRGHRSVGSKDGARANGRTRPIALPPPLTRSVIIIRMSRNTECCSEPEKIQSRDRAVRGCCMQVPGVSGVGSVFIPGIWGGDFPRPNLQFLTPPQKNSCHILCSKSFFRSRQ